MLIATYHTGKYAGDVEVPDLIVNAARLVANWLERQERDGRAIIQLCGVCLEKQDV